MLLCLAGVTQAEELEAISVEQFAGDNRAQRVEIVTSHIEDGTTTLVALLTYSDGRQENCTFEMVAETAEKDGVEGLTVAPKSRECTPASRSN